MKEGGQKERSKGKEREICRDESGLWGERVGNCIALRRGGRSGRDMKSEICIDERSTWEERKGNEEVKISHIEGSKGAYGGAGKSRRNVKGKYIVIKVSYGERGKDMKEGRKGGWIVGRKVVNGGEEGKKRT